MYMYTDMTHISLKKSPGQIDSYKKFIRFINLENKVFSVITFFAKRQFWGFAKKDGMIEGNFFTDHKDYSTISNKKIFKGRFSSSLKNLVYEGFF